jgi:acyl carrier protein
MTHLRSILAKVLQIDAASITDATSPQTVPTWDSFNALMLVSELESHYGISFTMDEVSSVTCVGDIKKCLRQHGAVISDAE